MKLNKHQKEIILHIKNGEIYDVFTYIKFFDLGKTVKYDKEKVLEDFTHDSICKDYYYPYNLNLKPRNLLTINEFQKKCNEKEIDASKYKHLSLNLNYSYGIKALPIDNILYNIDFYNGVYIAKSFDTIIEFLSLWQYLKSEMLILEVPTQLSERTIGLFFEKDNSSPNLYTSSTDILKDIDYSTFTYADKHYLTENMYSFSNEHYAICKNFLEKRIYPTPQLNLYVKRKFKTSEESIQKSALTAAWVTILVSIILTIIPFIYTNFLSPNHSLKTTTETNTITNEENIKLHLPNEIFK